MVRINSVILERNAVAVTLGQSVMAAQKGEIMLYPVRDAWRVQRTGNLNRIYSSSYDEAKPNKITKSQYRGYLATLKLNLQALLDVEKDIKAKASTEKPLLRSNVAMLMQKGVEVNYTVPIQQHATILKA